MSPVLHHCLAVVRSQSRWLHHLLSQHSLLYDWWCFYCFSTSWIVIFFWGLSRRLKGPFDLITCESWQHLPIISQRLSLAIGSTAHFVCGKRRLCFSAIVETVRIFASSTSYSNTILYITLFSSISPRDPSQLDGSRSFPFLILVNELYDNFFSKMPFSLPVFQRLSLAERTASSAPRLVYSTCVTY